MISIAAVGDVTDPQTWSGTAWHFWQALHKLGIETTPWQVNPGRLKTDRVLWNARQALRLNGPGGYQFSDTFLKEMETQVPAEYFRHQIISFNQLFPRSKTVRRAGGRLYRYIDATLLNLIREPSYKISITKKNIPQVIDREKKSYEGCEKIVVMAAWVKESLMAEYEVPENKIEHILPGANLELSDSKNAIPFSPGAGVDRPFALGFVGKNWQRKGLPLIIRLAEALNKRSYKVEVRVIGPKLNAFPNHSLIRFSGYIDKQKQSELFIREIQRCDIGCFFSESEAMGIAPLEFIRLGVPVMGYAHQGLADALIPESAIRFDKGDNMNTILHVIEEYIEVTEKQIALKQAAEKMSEHVTWNRCVNEFLQVLS